MLITHKLGGLLAYEMPLEALHTLVRNAQLKRSINRAIIRSSKIAADKKTTAAGAKRITRTVSLSASGLADGSIKMLREQWPGKTDAQLLDMLKGKGLL